MLVVWCPDWPVVAACAASGTPPHVPAAVLAANRVVACSATARAEGVHRGARKREAQSRCPELVVFDDDPERDARWFEPVAAAVEELAPGVEVVRPGVVAVPVQGPVGYFGRIARDHAGDGAPGAVTGAGESAIGIRPTGQDGGAQQREQVDCADAPPGEQPRATGARNGEPATGADARARRGICDADAREQGLDADARSAEQPGADAQPCKRGIGIHARSPKPVDGSRPSGQVCGVAAGSCEQFGVDPQPCAQVPGNDTRTATHVVDAPPGAQSLAAEEVVAERLIDHVAVGTGVECQVGIADGLFAATLAARRGVLVPAGGSREFLARLPVAELLVDDVDRSSTVDGQARAELVELLWRLGLRTLGAFAAVPPADVASRFGAAAMAAHRLARGLEERPPVRRRPPPDLAVTQELDPPVDRVDAAAFAARALAERLHEWLARAGLACTRLRIRARTEHGEELARVWRCADPLTAHGTADRVRWQLDGWLTGRSGARPTAGVGVLRLEPVEVVEAASLQLDLFRGAGDTPGAERAARALVHVQGLLGPEGVLTPVLGGGRGPAERVRLVQWGDERRPALDPDAPWPGRLPPPTPTVLPERPTPAEVLDAEGNQVGVSGRHEMTAPPVWVRVAGAAPRQVVAWGGPWTVHERWWVTEELQAGTGTGTATPGRTVDPAARPAGPGTDGTRTAPGAAGRAGATVGARRAARLQVVLATEDTEDLFAGSSIDREFDGHRTGPGATGTPASPIAPGASTRGPRGSATLPAGTDADVPARPPYRGAGPADPPAGAGDGGVGLGGFGAGTGETALLLVREGGQWWVEGLYD
ncbi:DNA polymerase Y family protein [Longimycelium tulufanense]|nr:hypothetical protein [Longimycelium tulufanense]